MLRNGGPHCESDLSENSIPVCHARHGKPTNQNVGFSPVEILPVSPLSSALSDPYCPTFAILLSSSFLIRFLQRV
jgi:hypothetical protein